MKQTTNIRLIAIAAIAVIPMIVRAEVDTVMLRITYDATSMSTMEDSALFNDVQVLDIGRHSSKYFSIQQQIFEHHRDSAMGGETGVEKYMEFYMSEDRPEYGRVFRVYKNYPAKGTLTYTDCLYDCFFKYEEPMPEPYWQMEEGDTIIATYPCHKATTEFHGRKWTAWYSLDLPFDDGPWKLRGLPGLILQASESEGIFSFTCKGVSQPANLAIVFDKENYEDCKSGKAFEQTQKKYYLNQRDFILRHAGLGYLADALAPDEPFTACLLEFYP